MRYPEVRLEIRRARVEDAEGVARVHIASWQATYRGIVSDETLDGLRLEERAAMWRDCLQRLAMDPPPRQEACYVAVDAANRVVGFARGGKARPLANGQPPEPYDGELYEIYLTPGGERRGTGSRLAHDVASQLVAGGVRAAGVGAGAKCQPPVL
jgi:ribosomal protein S18 acetylase RimI-like enzyme